MGVCIGSALLLMCSIPILFAWPVDEPQTSGQDAKIITWQGHKFREVTTLRELPPGLQEALGVGRPGWRGIADRDGKFNPIDAIDRTLPSRRFVTAGLDGDTALVAIEHGGIALRMEVVLYSPIGRDAAVKGTWRLLGVPRTLQAVVDRLSRR